MPLQSEMAKQYNNVGNTVPVLLFCHGYRRRNYYCICLLSYPSQNVTDFALKISTSLESYVSITVSTSLVIWVNKSLLNMAFQLRNFSVKSLRLTATISCLLWWISLNYTNGTEVHAVYSYPRSIKAIILMSKPNQSTSRRNLVSLKHHHNWEPYL